MNDSILVLIAEVVVIEFRVASELFFIRRLKHTSVELLSIISFNPWRKPDGFHKVGLKRSFFPSLIRPPEPPP